MSDWKVPKISDYVDLDKLHDCDTVNAEIEALTARCEKLERVLREAKIYLETTRGMTAVGDVNLIKAIEAVEGDGR